MYLGSGLRICENAQRLSPQVWKDFEQFSTPDISDIMHGLCVLDPEIQNRVNDSVLIGPAITVKLPAFDNLMLHKALDFVQAGDVLVVQAGGKQAASAVCGDLLAHKMYHKGVAGLMVDGLIRDIDGLKELGLPIFARGITPIGPRKNGPGEINTPIACGGQVIVSGDLIVADTMGAVVIPRKEALDILNLLKAQKKEASHYREQVQAGPVDTRWVDKHLLELGIPLAD